MDVNTLRSIVTLLSFVGFLGIVVWAFTPRRKAQFDKAGWMALLDEASAPGAQPASQRLGDGK